MQSLCIGKILGLFLHNYWQCCPTSESIPVFKELKLAIMPHLQGILSFYFPYLAETYSLSIVISNLTVLYNAFTSRKRAIKLDTICAFCKLPLEVLLRISYAPCMCQLTLSNMYLWLPRTRLSVFVKTVPALRPLTYLSSMYLKALQCYIHRHTTCVLISM